MIAFDQANIQTAVQMLAQATPGLLKIPTTNVYDPETGTSLQNYEAFNIRALRSSKGQKYASSFSEETLLGADEIWMLPNTTLPPVPGSIIDISTSPSLLTERYLSSDPDGMEIFSDMNGEFWVRVVDDTANSVIKDYSGNVMPATTLKKGYLVKLGLVLGDPLHLPTQTTVFIEKIYQPGSEPFWQLVAPGQPPLSTAPGKLWRVIEMFRGPGLQDPAYYLVAMKSQ